MAKTSQELVAGLGGRTPTDAEVLEIQSLRTQESKARGETAQSFEDFEGGVSKITGQQFGQPTTPTSALMEAGAVTSADLGDIEAREQDRLSELMDIIGGQYDEAIQETRERGEAVIGGEKARLGISRGLGASSSRISFLENIRQENEKLVNDLVKAKAEAEKTLDFESADRIREQIKEAQEMSFRNRQQALKEQQQAFEQGITERRTSLAERGEERATEEFEFRKEQFSFDKIMEESKFNNLVAQQEIENAFASQQLEQSIKDSLFDQTMRAKQFDADQKQRMASNYYRQQEIDLRKESNLISQMKAQGEMTPGTKAENVVDKLNLVKNSINNAKNLAEASGRSGLRKTAEAMFVGSTDYTNLVAETNTLRTNVLTLATDPDIKKFFGPQMSEADVRLMTSAGTTLNPELQSPEFLMKELDRLSDVMSKLERASIQMLKELPSEDKPQFEGYTLGADGLYYKN